MATVSTEVPPFSSDKSLFLLQANIRRVMCRFLSLRGSEFNDGCNRCFREFVTAAACDALRMPVDPKVDLPSLTTCECSVGKAYRNETLHFTAKQVFASP